MNLKTTIMRLAVIIILELSLFLYLVVANKTESQAESGEDKSDDGHAAEVEKLMKKYKIPFKKSSKDDSEGESRGGIMGKATISEIIELMKMFFGKYTRSWSERLRDFEVMMQEAHPGLQRHEQSTTNLLLFTKPGSGYIPQARISSQTPKSMLQKSGFNESWPTVILTHGFLTSGMDKDQWAKDIKDLMLKKGNGNFFFADWNHISFNINYASVKEEMITVARDIYATIKNLHDAFPDFDPSQMHIMGHSLGAHIVGLLGQLLDGNVKQITGLDPAGPLLEHKPPDAIITKGDGKYVVAHHTNIDVFGTPNKLADRDVFFEGGEYQPSCRGYANGTGRSATCRHKQAPSYNGAYMGKCIMVAYKCPTYDQFNFGECASCEEESNSCVTVGNYWQYDDLDEKYFIPENHDVVKRSKDEPPSLSAPAYFIKTGPESPYCAYHYQIIVSFTNETKMSRNIAMNLILSTDNSTAIIDATFTRIADTLRTKLEAVDPKNEDKLKTITGSVTTALVTVDPKSEQYNSLPAKFTKAEMAPISYQYGHTIDMVYVNFMSHPDSEKRKSYSSALKVSNKDVQPHPITATSQMSGSTLETPPKISKEEMKSLELKAAMESERQRYTEHARVPEYETVKRKKKPLFRLPFGQHRSALDGETNKTIGNTNRKMRKSKMKNTSWISGGLF